MELPVELRSLVERHHAADRVRVSELKRENTRHRGVSWSAMSPGPASPAPDKMLLAAAEAELRRREAWSATPAGRFFVAMARAQRAALAAHAAGERARAAVSRSFDNELEHCAATAEELVACARSLVQSARQARQAVRAAREL